MLSIPPSTSTIEFCNESNIPWYIGKKSFANLVSSPEKWANSCASIPLNSFIFKNLKIGEDIYNDLESKTFLSLLITLDSVTKNIGSTPIKIFSGRVELICFDNSKSILYTKLSSLSVIDTAFILIWIGFNKLKLDLIRFKEVIYKYFLQQEIPIDRL